MFVCIHVDLTIARLDQVVLEELRRGNLQVVQLCISELYSGKVTVRVEENTVEDSILQIQVLAFTCFPWNDFAVRLGIER